MSSTAPRGAGWQAGGWVCLAPRLSVPLHSPACAAPGTGGHRGFHTASYVTCSSWYGHGPAYCQRVLCCFVTLFVEPTLDCCRTAVPVVFLLTLTNRGVGLEWDDVAAGVRQRDVAWLEMGKAVISPWQTGK